MERAPLDHPAAEEQPRGRNVGTEGNLMTSTTGKAIPDKLITDGGEGGGAPRLRVDPGSTGFFARREFRAFMAFDAGLGTQIPTGRRVLLRAVTAVNTIFVGLAFDFDNGALRLTTYNGGTPTGTFNQTLPIVSTNSMTEKPAYTPVTVLTATAPGTSGTVSITGGTVIDLVRLKSANATASTTTISATSDNPRGVPAGVTFYLLIENISNGDAEGTIHLRFEERP